MLNSSSVHRSVSIVVPVYNAEDFIELCVRSLLNQVYAIEEIIIVDNGSTDQTVDILSKYPVKMVSEEKKGVAHALNTGIKEAKGEIIAITESDCIADRFWVYNLVKHYINNKIGGLGGEFYHINQQTFWDNTMIKCIKHRMVEKLR